MQEHLPAHPREAASREKPLILARPLIPLCPTPGQVEHREIPKCRWKQKGWPEVLDKLCCWLDESTGSLYNADTGCSCSPSVPARSGFPCICGALSYRQVHVCSPCTAHPHKQHTCSLRDASGPSFQMLRRDSAMPIPAHRHPWTITFLL